MTRLKSILAALLIVGLFVFLVWMLAKGGGGLAKAR